jgi:hypothetical protein
MFTAGQLEVDGKSYTPKTKEPAPKKAPKPKAEAKPKVAGTRQRAHVKRQAA